MDLAGHLDSHLLLLLPHFGLLAGIGDQPGPGCVLLSIRAVAPSLHPIFPPTVSLSSALAFSHRLRSCGIGARSSRPLQNLEAV